MFGFELVSRQYDILFKMISKFLKTYLLTIPLTYRQSPTLMAVSSPTTPSTTLRPTIQATNQHTSLYSLQQRRTAITGNADSIQIRHGRGVPGGDASILNIPSIFLTCTFWMCIFPTRETCVGFARRTLKVNGLGIYSQRILKTFYRQRYLRRRIWDLRTSESWGLFWLLLGRSAHRS